MVILVSNWQEVYSVFYSRINLKFESPKATITQRPHMKQPQTSLIREKPSWSLFRGGKVKLAWSKKPSTDICLKKLLQDYD